MAARRGKVAAEAASVTAGAVRCSAWLGVAGEHELTTRDGVYLSGVIDRLASRLAWLESLQERTPPVIRPETHQSQERQLAPEQKQSSAEPERVGQ